MKRLFLAFLLCLCALPASATTTWYVSDVAASNGFLAIGNDTTGNGTKATPYLTIVKAESVAATGDIIAVNTGTYAETSGSGYLSIAKVITVETDPVAARATGKATLRNTTSGRVFAFNATAAVLQDFIVDGQSQSQNGVTFNNSAVCIRCDYKNFTSTASACYTNANSVTITNDTCTMTVANGNASTSSMCVTGSNTAISLIGKGITLNGVQSFNIATSIGLTLIQLVASSNGTRNTITSCTYGVEVPNTQATAAVDIESTDFTSIGTASIYDFTSVSGTITALTVKYCTFASTGSNNALDFNIPITAGNISYNYCTSTQVFLKSRQPTFTNTTVDYNTILNTSSGDDPISLQWCGPGIEVGHNTITSDSPAGHCIIVGTDGCNIQVSNLATKTTTVSLGAASGNVYAAQTFTANASGPSQLLSAFRIPLAKVGSPTGTVNAYLYSNNSGVPGTLIATSEYSLAISGLSTSSQNVEFWFAGHPTTTNGTAYWAVLKYTGTQDGSNYVAIDANTSKTSVQTAPDGSTWTGGSASIMYQVAYNDFEGVNPIVDNNTINVTTLSSGPHGILIGGTYGGKIYNNLMIGVGIGGIFKDVDGSGANTSLCYDNLTYVNTTYASSLGGYADKGSRSSQYLHNTVVLTTPGYAGMSLIGDFVTSPSDYNGQASTNAVVKNNIFYVTSTGTTSKGYAIGGNNTVQPTCVNPTINNNLLYIGARNVYAGVNYSSGSTVNYIAYSSLQGAGFDTNGKNADPLLPGEAGPSVMANFLPPANSPVVGMGLNLTTTVPSDYNGNAFLAVGPTVGALNAKSRAVSAARTPIR